MGWSKGEQWRSGKGLKVEQRGQMGSMEGSLGGSEEEGRGGAWKGIKAGHKNAAEE